MKKYNLIYKKNKQLKNDYRTNNRYEYNCKFKIESINLEKVNLEVTGVNLSLSGIAFLSNTTFELNDLLEISFKYSNVTMPTIIKVQHVSLYDSGFFVGGEFIALQNTYREILKDLI